MRLFVFAIGGTGARVLNSLTMLLASGVPLINTRGDKYELVPLIIDSDTQNGNVNSTDALLRNYCNIQSSLDPIGADRTIGFYNTKITPLTKIGNPNASINFLYQFDGQRENPFSEFIDFNNLEPHFQKFIKTLYTPQNLNDNTSVGFKGNPNVGSVFLNSFPNSPEFNIFTQNFNVNTDRVMVIGSIFGGTGAAGMPLIVKTIRQTVNVANATIGTMVVMPYFHVGIDPNGNQEIDSNTFITKTKAALNYYNRNFNEPNAMYYLADSTMGNPVQYSVGAATQHNDAHVMEVFAALGIFHFASIAQSVVNPPANINVARLAPNLCFEFGIENNNANLSFSDLGLQNRLLLNKHLTNLFYLHFLFDTLAQSNSAWRPEIGFTRTDYTDFDTFRTTMATWLSQLSTNNRAFTPFSLNENRLTHLVRNFAIREGIFNNFDLRSIEVKLNANAVSREVTNFNTPKQKFFKLFHMTMEALIQERINIQ